MSYVLFIIAIALVFDFINGMHDSANSIATVVSTRVLSPLVAVVWAAFFNFVAAFTFGTAVAKTMGKGLIDVSIVDSDVVLGGLIQDSLTDGSSKVPLVGDIPVAGALFRYDNRDTGRSTKVPGRITRTMLVRAYAGRQRRFGRR